MPGPRGVGKVLIRLPMGEVVVIGEDTYDFSKPYRLCAVTDVHTYTHRACDGWGKTSNMHVYMCIYTGTHVYMYRDVYVCIYMYVYICIYMYIYIYIHMYAYLYIHICIYTYLYLYIHTTVMYPSDISSSSTVIFCSNLRIEITFENIHHLTIEIQ